MLFDPWVIRVRDDVRGLGRRADLHEAVRARRAVFEIPVWRQALPHTASSLTQFVHHPSQRATDQR